MLARLASPASGDPHELTKSTERHWNKPSYVYYSDNSSNPANLAKISPVDGKIIGLRGIVKNKKQQQNIEPAAALLLHRSRAG